MTDYTEPSDVDIHASPETVQAYISALEAHRDELDALLNEGIATDADTRQQARNDALREAALIAQSPNLPIFRDGWTSEQDAAAISAMMKISDAILALINAPAPDPVQQAAGWGDLIASAVVEAEKAMQKFPQPNYVISKFAEEAGEVVKALIHHAEGRESREAVIGEMRQTIAMLYRLWIEGDEVHGLRPLAGEPAQ